MDSAADVEKDSVKPIPFGPKVKLPKKHMNRKGEDKAKRSWVE